MSVRTRLALIAVVSISALVTLVAYNASRLFQQSTNLRNESSTGRLGGEASLPLFYGIQTERKLSAVYLAAPSASARAALDKQRQQTDQAVTSFRQLSGTTLPVQERRKFEFVEKIYTQLDDLAAVRGQADGRTGDPDQTVAYYTSVIVGLIEFYQALSAMDDPALTLETRPLVGLFWASDALSQEDMLIAEAQASGQMSPEHRVAFAEAYGTQSVMYDKWIAPYLTGTDQAAYTKIVQSAAWRSKTRIEKVVIDAPTSSVSGVVEDLPRAVDDWDGACGPVAGEIAKLNLARTQGLLEHGFQRADQVRSQVLWQVGGSLAAVVVIAVMIVWNIVSIVRRIKALRTGTLESSKRLSAAVARLQAGEHVDVDAEFPAGPWRQDEFGTLEEARAGEQRTAVDLAVAQARDRGGFTGFVAATAGRSLNLVEGQLRELDRLEKKYGKDTEVLKELFGLDRIAVRTRRNLDDLLTLADANHVQPYVQPRTLIQLVEDAVGEAEDHERVEPTISHRQGVKAQAVNALMHIIAALVTAKPARLTPRASRSRRQPDS